MVETNGGATTSFGYRIELHPAPHDDTPPVEAAFLYGALRNDCAYGVDLHWRDATTLDLHYARAKSVDARRSVRIGDRIIRIVPRPGVPDPTADCGAMAKA